MTLSDSQTGGLSSSSSTPTPTLGKYKIIRVIARSNDVVYEAIDPGINRRLAVKELALSPNLSGRQRRERIERFYREAKAAGNLTHPNIVTVFEVGQEGDRHYIAMEYLEGPSLRDILRMRNNLSIKEALSVTLQLADALGYAHGQGVIHRDVKPDNVHLVLPNDTVKLTDFGIARILADPSITSTGQVFGTPSYMSPEQIMSKEVDHRTDIFSLGVVLYEMIVGKKPFTGDSVITITYHIMNTAPVMPASLPTGVYNIMNRALTKDPSMRYQNMAALAADIQSELAFADLPYHTLSPTTGAPETYSSEITEEVHQNQLARPTIQTPSAPRSGIFAPPTGISDSTSTGPSSGPMAQVLPVSTPQVMSDTRDGSAKNAMVLVGTVIGVVVLVLIVVFSVAKAYSNNEKTKEAMVAYDRANAERLSGDNIDAERDYQEALDDAPSGSAIATNAKQALSESPSSPTVPDSQLNGTILQQAPDLSGTPGQNSPTTTPTTPPAIDPSSLAPAGPQVAANDLSQAKSYMAQGDQNDAVTQFEAAATADPTGPSGKQAGSQLAEIFSQAADAALAAGNTKTALQDWQLIEKYAPDDPLANDASQKILQYSIPSTTPSGSSGSSDQPVSEGQ